jgi:adenylate cyclase
VSQTRKLAAILVARSSTTAGSPMPRKRILARIGRLGVDLLDRAIVAHRGRIIKRAGDGVLIEFRRVVDAVRCAIDVQTGFIGRNADPRPTAASSFASAFIWATSWRRAGGWQRIAPS